MKAKLYLMLFLCGICCCSVQQLFAQPAFPGTVIAASPDPESVTIPSPSLVILPDSSYVASHDKTPTTSAIYRSTDKGLTWTNIATVDSSHWSTLFCHNNILYLMGTSKSRGSITIHRSTDNGFTWTKPTNGLNGLLLPGGYHTAPVPVVHHNGKIWRAYEDLDTVDGIDVYGAFMYSAADTSDLMNATSWTRTNSIFYKKEWINAKYPRWREGNAVVAPDGSIVNFIRFETMPSSADAWEVEGGAAGKQRYFIAAKLQVDSAGSTISFDTTAAGYVSFQGPESKFTIRYDSVSGKYWSLVNKITSVHQGTSTYTSPYRQRNVIVLISSTDLVNWTEHCKVIRWNEGAVLDDENKFGFQYWDWQFEGDDIIAVSRTGWYGRNYHDANLMTFHRVTNFRTKTMDESPEDIFPVTQNYHRLQGWQFSNPAAPGTQLTQSSGFDTTGMEKSVLSRGAGLVPGGLQRSINSTFTSYGSPYNIKDSAIAKKEYYQFTVQAKAGYELSLSTINARLRRNTAGPTAYAWYYSLDSINYTQIGNDVTGFTDNNTNGVLQPPVHLSTISSLQGLLDGAKVFFRIYAWGVTAATGNLAIGRYDATDTTHSLVVYGNIMPVDSSGILAAWQFSKPSAYGLETYYAATTNDARITQASLARGTGMKPTTFSRSFISLLTSYTAPDNNKAAAVANNEYYEFVIEPREGNKISLESLEAKLRRNTAGCAAYRWRYSVNGGTDFTELGSADVPFTTFSTEGNVQPSVDLSSVTALQDIVAGTKVIFRLYAWGATAANGNFGIGRYPADSLTNSLVVRGKLEKDNGSSARSAFPKEAIIAVPIEASASTNVFPNPTSGEINIVFTPGVYSKALLVDINGRILRQWSINKNERRLAKNIDFAGTGFYFLRVEGKGKTEVFKIVKD